MRSGYMPSNLSKAQKKEHYLNLIGAEIAEPAKVVPFNELHIAEEKPPQARVFPRQPRFAPQQTTLLVRNLPPSESMSFNYRIYGLGDEPWN